MRAHCRMAGAGTRQTGPGVNTPDRPGQLEQEHPGPKQLHSRLAEREHPRLKQLHTRLAEREHIPPGWSRNTPPGWSRNIPPGWGRNTASGWGGNTPSGWGRNTSSGWGRNTPSGWVRNTPPRAGTLVTAKLYGHSPSRGRLPCDHTRSPPEAARRRPPSYTARLPTTLLPAPAQRREARGFYAAMRRRPCSPAGVRGGNKKWGHSGWGWRSPRSPRPDSECAEPSSTVVSITIWKIEVKEEASRPP